MKWSAEVKQFLDRALIDASRLPKNQRIAAFDADGTLWPGDAGESFFKYQITHKLAPGLKGIKDPWAFYKKAEETVPFDAYSWLVGINAGLHWSEMRQQGRDFIRSSHFNSISEPMSEIIETLFQNGFQIWICSASMKWALEPALERDLRVPYQLISFECILDSKGCLTPSIKQPMPYAKGKMEALSVRLAHPPLLSFGNSMGDLNLLEWAQLTPVVIRYQPFNPVNEKTESSIGAIANARGWPIQIF